MRLFISYARADRPICSRVLGILREGHRAWHDERIYVGDKWWDIIVKRIKWSDGIVFLISPRSINSVYCKKEFRLAELSKKYIFPILIAPAANMPEYLSRYQYIDMSEGLTVDNITELHHSMLMRERELWKAQPRSQADREDLDVHTMPDFNIKTYMTDIIKAMANEEYDNAIYWLRIAINKGYTSDIHDLPHMLLLAEELIAEQQKSIQSNTEYNNIIDLVKDPRTIQLGAKAYENFRRLYPDFVDRENIADQIQSTYMPPIEWCEIPEGHVSITYKNRRYRQTVERFRISKYPITNAQFDVFVKAEDGYANPRWWDFSEEACKWRTYHPNPPSLRPADGKDYPRVNISWYDARAFCDWLGYRSGFQISLPSEQEWQRAAQGDDNRLYPWGNKFNQEFCNGQPAHIGRLSPVKQFKSGKSPFGVVDMCGNAWEWTLSGQNKTDSSANGDIAITHRIAKGGSYSSKHERLRCHYRISFHASSHFGTIGFRVVAKSR